MVLLSIFSDNVHSCVQNILSVLQKKSGLILFLKNEALLLDQVAPEIMWICWLWRPVLTFFRAKLFTLKVLVLMLALLWNNFGTLKFQCILKCKIMWMFKKLYMRLHDDHVLIILEKVNCTKLLQLYFQHDVPVKP